jgi:hypothetical protein
MKEARRNLWDTPLGDWRCITTNGSITRIGKPVMGRGCALQAKTRYPLIEDMLATHLNRSGNVIGIFPHYRLITFPVKHHWYQKADPLLIRRSAIELRDIALHSPRVRGATFWLPRPGCGNGHLDWLTIRPILRDILPDNVVVIHNGIQEDI